MPLARRPLSPALFSRPCRAGGPLQEEPFPRARKPRLAVPGAPWGLCRAGVSGAVCALPTCPGSVFPLPAPCPSLRWSKLRGWTCHPCCHSPLLPDGAANQTFVPCDPLRLSSLPAGTFPPSGHTHGALRPPPAAMPSTSLVCSCSLLPSKAVRKMPRVTPGAALMEGCAKPLVSPSIDSLGCTWVLGDWLQNRFCSSQR